MVRAGSPDPAAARPGPLLTRPIPSTGEKLPLVGLGSWITFNVGDDTAARDSCAEVMRAFFEAGGTADRLLADVRLVAGGDRLRPAHKLGPPAAALRGRQGLDLLGRARPGTDRGVPPALGRPALRPAAGPQPAVVGGASADAVRDEGGRAAALRRHHDVGRAAPRRDRADHAERSRSTSCRSPTTSSTARSRSGSCRWRGARHRRDLQPAVPAGRADPERVERAPLPAWAAEIDCANWAQFLLKFIVSHPAVTCAIPATTQRRPRAGEHGRRPTGGCPTRRCAAASPPQVEKL